MIKAIIFDFDDTLVNTFQTKALAIQHTAKEIYKVELALETIKSHWGKPYREMMLNIFEQIPDEVDSIIENYEKIRKDFPSKLIDNVEETLNKLKDRILLGILTSTSKPLVLADLTVIGLNHSLFFYIQTAEDSIVHKPNPKVFEPILSKLREKGINKEEIVYIGDSLNDYYAARDAGIKFYGLTTGNTSKEQFKKEGVIILNSFDEILNLLND